MRQKISALTSNCKKSKKPHVLVSIERNIKAESAKISESYLAGSSSFYGDLLTKAGAENVYTERKIKYPKLGGEGLLTIDPDIVIDIVSTDKTDISGERLIQAWRNLFSIRAGKGELPVYIIDSDYAVIPGIRSIKLLGDFARIIKGFGGGCN
jgi:ABC-type Fe3+-hydroxamate transport system substrate-binding protein